MFEVVEEADEETGSGGVGYSAGWGIAYCTVYSISLVIAYSTVYNISLVIAYSTVSSISLVITYSTVYSISLVITYSTVSSISLRVVYSTVYNISLVITYSTVSSISLVIAYSTVSSISLVIAYSPVSSLILTCVCIRPCRPRHPRRNDGRGCLLFRRSVPPHRERHGIGVVVRLGIPGIEAGLRQYLTLGVVGMPRVQAYGLPYGGV